MKYTKEQMQRAHKKLAVAYGKWNVIEEDDYLTRTQREMKMHEAAWKVIVKSEMMNEYFLATGDCRGKKKKGEGRG